MTSFKNICILTGLTGMLFMSCKDKATTDEATETGVQTENVEIQTGTQVDPGTEAPIPAVTLQHGVQWSADEHATNGIKNMITLVGNMPANAGAGDYATLKNGLEAEMTMIMNKTTMSGDARTQLDNYLLPMKAIFENFADSDPAVRQDALQQLNTHLRTYRTYFQ